MTGREFDSELPSPQREFVECLRDFAGARGEAPQPLLLRDATMESARTALLADTELGRWGDVVNVQLLGLLAWCRALDDGDHEELRFAAEWLEMTFRCAPELLPEPLRSARRERFTVDGLSALAEDRGQGLARAAEFIRDGLGWGGVRREVAAHVRSRRILRADPPDHSVSAGLARWVAVRLPGSHWLGFAARVRAVRSLGGMAVAVGSISSEEALRASEDAVTAIPEGHPWEAQVLSLFQMHLIGVALSHGQDSFFSGIRPLPFDTCLKAVEAGRRALAVLEDDDTDRLTVFHTHTGALGQLLLACPEDPAIRDELWRHSRLEVAQQHDAAGRSVAWLQLSWYLFPLFAHTGDAYFFSEHATAAGNAYRCAPPGSVEHARAARELGKAKTMAASRSPDPAAFDEPVDFYRSVIEGVGLPVATDSEEDAAERAITLANARGGLKEALEARYQRNAEWDSRQEVVLAADASDAPALVPPAAPAEGDLTGRLNRRQWITAALWEAAVSLTSKTEQMLEDRNPAAVRTACGEFLARVDELAALAPDDRQIQETAAGLQRTAQLAEARARALETGEDLPLGELVARGRQQRDWIAPRLGTTTPHADPRAADEDDEDRLQRLSAHQLKDHEVAKALELVARTEAMHAIGTEGEESADAWARAPPLSPSLSPDKEPNSAPGRTAASLPRIDRSGRRARHPGSRRPAYRPRRPAPARRAPRIAHRALRTGPGHRRRLPGRRRRHHRARPA
ncbi:hypothetical protein [Streptomyces sp. UNOB3_S3]|uniref:hypothetical protein n=1 Tax=Streptomyces sp. UNOB3_S3 TaxID=2871682 RepID=UPI001E43A4ED|nr:hypothetical protein [Streptomyces sp. UNOB3_S3]MCC3776058.1 hypothetical protein [Streptomyces sp. UNOB3_S3]